MSLRAREGGAIDRNQPLRFCFDGREYVGFKGDTLASALLANGVRVTARSFKYHRPRGIVGASFEEPNTLVQLGAGARTEPNLKATQIELFDGLQARAVNCWPSARFDVLAVIRLFKALMPSGFYYKTFLWPGWKWFEGIIRAAAGLGHSPTEPDPDRYDKRYESVDLLVVGAGAAGIEAAAAAANAGKRVTLVDDKPVAKALEGVCVLDRCTAFGYYDHDYVVAVQRLSDASVRQRLWHFRAKEVVLATGAVERPLVFPNNDRPGVMLASAAQEYLQRYAVLPGRRAVLATNNDSVYTTALKLLDAGVEIAAILDVRANSSASGIAELANRGVAVEWKCAPTNTIGKAITSVEWHRVDENGRALPGTARFATCDCLLVSGGWNPTVHLFSQSGGGLRYDEGVHAFVPNHSVQRTRAIGAAAGAFDRDHEVQPLWSVDVSSLGRAPAYSWVDFASDVTEGDLRLAVRENFSAVEHLKRYTTTGMMADQGKTSNVNAIGILGGIVGKAPGDVGTTKFRPPFDPVTFGALAGANVEAFYQPLRRLPTDALLRELGAKMEDYGGWSRPAYFANAGEREADAFAREVKLVRNGVGIIDYSPLGKILVHGPDAATFLQRIYVNNVKTLKPGSCRYGLMLGEDGIVMDDGVLTRWDEQTFQVGTTSGHAERVTDWLEEWLQCEWTDLDVIVEPVTTQWATVMVAGPRSRALLERVVGDIDLSGAAFPHMTARSGRFGDAPARIMRVSFTGELSYEVSVPWRQGAALWQRLLELGRDLGAAPFGIEALMVMRIEKGYLHVGTETDGATMPQDIGFAEIIAKKAEDFAGRRSTMTPEGLRSNRRQLVGLAAQDQQTLLPPGAHVVAGGADGKRRSQGWVTSSVHSPTLGRPVAMALIENGRARMGEGVEVYDAIHQTSIAATIVNAAAYDPEGKRLHVE
ncbi:MAG TPA: 2Fe-2S iron-sulfur cluster-binding protein [Nevskiaceae bacterium]|nr:2Fe-2S iron-sulfur cluster-binding protein [Nevskiaceae bacterium]